MSAFEHYRPHVEAIGRRMKWWLKEPWPGFGEPLNGQTQRRATFEALVNDYAPDIIVESGSFLGFSTDYFATLNVAAVVTIEAHPGFARAARRRLAGRPHVELIEGDSAKVLPTLGDRGSFPLFYLDAHWGPDLPLNHEIHGIEANWDESIVVIDDFCVPGRPGYGYDIYDGEALELRKLECAADVIAFPSGDPVSETGGRRGTLYLAYGPRATGALSRCIDRGELEPAEEPG